jgi:hypothetical protein
MDCEDRTFRASLARLHAAFESAAVALIAESPPAFRSRLITGAEPLERARLPSDVERIRMPRDDRAAK